MLSYDSNEHKEQPFPCKTSQFTGYSVQKGIVEAGNFWRGLNP